MTKNLTQSSIDRQNILNNTEVIELLESKLDLTGLLYNDEYKFTTKMVMDFYDISRITVIRYVNNHQKELSHNGYQVLKGLKLKEFKNLFGPLIATEYDGISQSITDDTLLNQNTENQSYKKIKALAVFNFRAVLNLGMLLTESQKAKQIRSILLDIAIDTINERIGGATKYINQREEAFLTAITQEPQYRKEFTTALNTYLEMGPTKYAIYTDTIYIAIFKENSREYRKILDLKAKENLRETLYSEVLTLIASFEVGIADEMKEKAEELDRKLIPNELDLLIESFANKRQWIPQIEDARVKMASRDYGMRNVIHERLQNYISTLSEEEYNRFLGKESESLIKRILDNSDLIDAFKRLKNR